jgi:excisionase family DNA binding protein
MTSFRIEPVATVGHSSTAVAAELGVSPETVGRWVRTGELAAIRLGAGPLARYRIAPEAIDAFLHTTTKEKGRRPACDTHTLSELEGD